MGKLGNKLDRGISKTLELGDRPFSSGSYEARIAELKKIKGTDVVTKEMEEDAINHAMKKYLTNDGELAKIFNNIKKASDNKLYQLAVNFLQPFTRFPANALNRSFEYVGGGLLKGLGHLIKTAPKGTFNQKYFVDQISRGLTGAGLSYLGAMLAKEGILTGSPPADKEAANYQKETGHLPYSIRFGDKTYSIDWAGVVASNLLNGADMYNAAKNKEAFINQLFAGGSTTIDTIFNMPVLKNVRSAFSGFDPAGSIGNSLLSGTSQFAPANASQIASYADTTERDTYDPNKLKQTANKFLNRIPIERETLPPKLDTTGKPIPSYGNNAFNAFLNPGFVGNIKDDVVSNELNRLYEESGETVQFPKLLNPKITYTNPQTKEKGNVQLTPEEKNKYQEELGSLLTKGFLEIINNPQYKDPKADDTIKAMMFQKFISNVNSRIRSEILRDKGIVAK